MKNKIFFLMSFVFMTSVIPAQAPKEIGGEALQILLEADNGKYSEYAKEYLRMYSIYVGDGTFRDYLNDGKKYTVFLPDNLAVEVYRKANPGFAERMRNTLKYSIVIGAFSPEDFTDGQQLKTLYAGGRYTVGVSKGKVSVSDMQGNKVRLNKSFTCGNITFYPVKMFLRY